MRSQRVGPNWVPFTCLSLAIFNYDACPYIKSLFPIFRMPFHGSLVLRVSQFSSVVQWCLTLCDLMDCSTPVFPVITNSRSLLKLISIESMMPSNHLILCSPLLLLSSRVSTHHLIPTQMFFILWNCPQASLSLENFSCLLLSFSITFYTYFHFSTYHSVWLFHICSSVSLSDCEVQSQDSQYLAAWHIVNAWQKLLECRNKWRDKVASISPLITVETKFFFPFFAFKRIWNSWL